MTTEPILVGKVEPKSILDGPSVYGFWYPNAESSTGFAWIGDFSSFEEAEFIAKECRNLLSSSILWITG